MAVRNSRPRKQNPYRYIKVDGVTYSISVDASVQLHTSKTKYSFAKQVLAGKYPVNPEKRAMVLQLDDSVKYLDIN